ncbi:MAG: glycoside hydrolase family 3 protein [bacterium]|nr:glycoside hydrolase family 3 protein [bacterium]
MRNLLSSRAILVCISLTLTACGGQVGSPEPPEDDAISPAVEKPDPAVVLAEERFAEMTPREKVGQLVMVGYFTALGRGDDTLSEEEQARNRLNGARELIAEYAVGNFIIFAGQNFSNYSDPPAPYDNLPEFIAAQTRALQSFAAERDNPIPLLISIDQEGGGIPLNRVRRGVAELPSPMSLGAAYAGSGDSAYTREIGMINGRWMGAMGVNVILGPLLDLASQPEYAGMETRPFCADPDAAYELGAAYVAGVADGSGGGVICCVKHFPGHGSTTYNADYNIYNSEDTVEELKAGRLYPFIEIVAEDGAGRPAAMMPCQMSLSFSSPPGVPITIDEGAMDTIFGECSELANWKDEGGLFITDDFGVRGIKKWMQKNGHPWTPNSIAKYLAVPSIIAGNDIMLLCSMEGGGYGHYDMVKGILIELEKRYIEGQDNPDDAFCAAVDDRCRAVLAAKARLYPDYDFAPLLLGFEERREAVRSATIGRADADAAVINEISDNALTLANGELGTSEGIGPNERVALVSPRKWELKAPGSMRRLFEECCDADFTEYTSGSAAGAIPRDVDWIVIAAATLYSADRAKLRSLIKTVDTSFPDARLAVIDGGYPVLTKETVAIPDVYVITFGHTRAAYAGAARWLCRDELTSPPGESPIPEVWR